MNIKDYLKKTYQIIIQYLGAGEQEVYYIGGAEKLPPPLSKKEELELLQRLKEELLLLLKDMESEGYIGV